jgi:hypothetical protein
MLFLLALLATAAACTDDKLSGPRKTNQAPEVWLSAAPPEGSLGKYTVKLYWGGWDPDGEIRYYKYLITDNQTGVFDPADLAGGEWLPVVANDSTFTFSADSLLNPNTKQLVTDFVRSHTFFIRAVDDEGVESEYVYRSFTSRTLSPEVTITIPARKTGSTIAEVPPIATFRWTAKDYVDDINNVQDPESVQYALKSTADFGGNWVQTLQYLNTPAAAHEWSPWVYYKAPDDSGKSWTTPPQAIGSRMMLAVRAKDEAGAITPVLDENFNARRILFSFRSTGPYFEVFNQYMGNVSTKSCKTPATILDLPSGVPIDFRIFAYAQDYGGIVSGYRYGWDIADLDDPEQWDVDYTPFTADRDTRGYENARIPARTFYIGTHVFTAEVLDNSGFCSRVEVKVNIVPFTLERNLLIVDDFKPDLAGGAGWNDPGGRGGLPNDAEHDAFWLSMVENLDGFDGIVDVIQVTKDSTVPLTKIANYKSIIWSASSDVSMGPAQVNELPLLYEFIKHRAAGGTQSGGKSQPNLIALTMAAGGHILIAGQHPLQNVVVRAGSNYMRYPFVPLFEAESPATQSSTPNIANQPGLANFAYREMCVDVIDYAYTNANRLRRLQANWCRVTAAIRAQEGSLRDDTMREARPIDPSFPTLTLRPECTAPGKKYQPSEQGLDVEIYNPRYFMVACPQVPDAVRSCFQPIYGVGMFDVGEPTYNQPVAFFTSAYADRVADVPGAVAARSVVFGFPPVYFNPDEVREAIEVIMFDEWKLPRKPIAAASN